MQFKLKKAREAVEGNVQQFTVDMKEAKSLSTLKKAMAVFKPVRTDFPQKHSAYKFQIAIGVVFHKAFNSAVVTQPPVALTSEIADVYADAASLLNDLNRQLLNFIEVYALCTSLQLSLWHLNPLRASAFVPLPNWIHTRRAIVNIRGTGNDCF